MKSNRYREYCKTNLSARRYFDSIEKLRSFEIKYNIDLDDFVPYGEDYSKASLLDKILAEEEHSEHLYFEINNYFRYCLDNSDSGSTEMIIADYSIIPDKFVFRGTHKDLVSKLSEFLSDKDAQTLASHISDYHDVLEVEEIVDVKRLGIKQQFEQNNCQMHFLLEDCEINITIKELSLMTIALLLDIKLTLGLASTSLALLGVNGQAIVKVTAEEGEICLIGEVLLRDNRIIDVSVLPVCSSECVNNDLQCKFRRDGKCTICAKDTEEILERLSEKNVFTKIKKYYKYNH